MPEVNSRSALSIEDRFAFNYAGQVSLIQWLNIFEFHILVSLVVMAVVFKILDYI